MTFTVGDIFIGNFNMYQGFGDKPEIYSSRYPIRGHNGIDFDCPSLTMILSAAPGRVIAVGTGDSFDAGGYGNYVKILHDGFLTLYAHLNDVAVKVGDVLIAGQLIGHSNNSGNSDFAHLHFALAPCAISGDKLSSDNGYGGYVDPQGESVVWNIKNITEPVIAQSTLTPPIPVDAKELSLKSQAYINLQAIIGFAKQNGLTDIDAGDSEGGTKINSWIAQLLDTRRIHSDALSIDGDEDGEHDPILDIARKHPLAKLKNHVVSYIWE